MERLPCVSLDPLHLSLTVITVVAEEHDRPDTRRHGGARRCSVGTVLGCCFDGLQAFTFTACEIALVHAARKIEVAFSGELPQVLLAWHADVAQPCEPNKLS